MIVEHKAADLMQVLAEKKMTLLERKKIYFINVAKFISSKHPNSMKIIFRKTPIRISDEILDIL